MKWKNRTHGARRSTAIEVAQISKKRINLQMKDNGTTVWPEHQVFKRLHGGAFVVLSLYCIYKRVWSYEARDAFPQIATRLDIWMKNMFLLTLATLMGYFSIKRILSDIFGNLKGIYRQLLYIILIYFTIALYGQVFSNMTGRMKGFYYRIFITYVANLWQMIAMLFITFLGVFYVPIYYTMRRLSDNFETIKKIILFISVTLCLFGLYHTLSPRILMEHSVNVSQRPSDNRYIKVIPISDVHLGHSMSVKDFSNLSQDILNIVNRDPENTLVLFMGDFFTFESEFNVAFDDALYEGLKPLQSIHKNVYISLGNHDYDLLDRVLHQLKRLHFTVLRDESLLLKKKRIQLVGFNYFFKNSDILARAVANNAKSEKDVDLRLLLLHNPSHFKYVASELNDNIPSITFSGHFHGGQFSGRNFLKSLRMGFVEAITSQPDYEWYGFDVKSESVKHLSSISLKPSDPLLYVCSGAGFYGPPLRIGTSSELPIIYINY